MLNSSLIEILRSFNKTEIKEFNDLVCSPYFNKKSAVIKFWNIIREYTPGFNSKEIERENVYKKIFPGKNYNYGTMKNLIYDLSKLAEKFIELKIYNEKTGSQSINLLEGFLGKGLKVFFKKNIKPIENNIEKKKAEADYYKNKYLLEISKQSYLIQQDIFHNNAAIIKSANENLTMGYFADIFNTNYSLLVWQYEHGGDHINDFIKKALAYYKSSPVGMDYRVKIYYNAFMLIYDGSASHFYELKKLLEDNIHNLSGEQKYNFFLAMGNFCIKKYNEGSMEFAKHEYETYRFMIDNKIYNANNAASMGGTFYKNVAIAAVKNSEFKWARSFIEKYKDMLEPEVKENYYFHALIEYNIKLKNFEEAVKYISRIKYTDTVAKLNIKRWEIITSYELEHFEKLRYLIDSTKHFFRNEKKLSHHTKLVLSNFVSIVSKIMVLNEVKNEKGLTYLDINTLVEELSKTDTSHKEWLLEKINELNAAIP
jgi:hypothetical protein